jgi:hypothetical protein
MGSLGTTMKRSIVMLYFQILTSVLTRLFLFLALGKATKFNNSFKGDDSGDDNTTRQ